MIKVGETNVRKTYHVMQEIKKGKAEPFILRGKKAQADTEAKAKRMARKMADKTKAIIVLQEDKQTTFILDEKGK